MSNRMEPVIEPNEGRGKDQGMVIFSTLLAGIGLYGALGWLADKFFGSSFLFPIGLVIGVVVSLYIIIKKFGSGA